MASSTIYHLVPRSEFQAGVKDGLYAPRRFAQDGFVHCAERGSVLAVAGDYFADLGEPLLLLAIDPARLGARIAYEPPAPIPGGGVAHLGGVELFPHVYGPIETDAMTGAAVLVKRGRTFEWPERFAGVREVLGHDAPPPLREK